ncbi:hypothetical protein CGMCC3_g11139 [Colletotrichum fructicola]|nr:uncharacterized protein CGMCC3_g11139 [Colletotrichum fructicola]KAE9572678.1 hypothetical protein CGMCC3_g11139 [Colletotrichum fructicola]
MRHRENVRPFSLATCECFNVSTMHVINSTSEDEKIFGIPNTGLLQSSKYESSFGRAAECRLHWGPAGALGTPMMNGSKLPGQASVG